MADLFNPFPQEEWGGGALAGMRRNYLAANEVQEAYKNALANRFYGPKTESEMALQKAQTEHYPYLNRLNEATTRSINSLAPGKLLELQLQNQFDQGMNPLKIAGAQRAFEHPGLALGETEKAIEFERMMRENPSAYGGPGSQPSQSNALGFDNVVLGEGGNPINETPKIQQAPAPEKSFSQLTPYERYQQSRQADLEATKALSHQRMYGRPGVNQAPLTAFEENLKDAVKNNPALYQDLTSTQKGRIGAALAEEGFTAFGAPLKEVSVAKISMLDNLIGSAEEIGRLVDQGVLTGPIEQYGATVAGPLFGMNQEQVDLNAVISNMNTLLLLARSGAAVTVPEYERLKGFIPLISDNPKTVKTKTARFISEMGRAKENYVKRISQTTGNVGNDVLDDSTMAKIQLPRGGFKLIPASKLDEALKRGAKRAN